MYPFNDFCINCSTVLGCDAEAWWLQKIYLAM
jgi:hypothetical protein